MEPTKSTDAVTLKNVTGAKKEPQLILETAKPPIVPLPQSNLLQRLRGFLPEMAAANGELAESSAMEFEVVNCAESSSDSDTNSDDSSDEESDDEMQQSRQENGTSSKKLVQIDLDLFRARNGTVGATDSEAQAVEELPKGFRELEEEKVPVEVSPKKLIEEM